MHESTSYNTSETESGKLHVHVHASDEANTRTMDIIQQKNPNSHDFWDAQKVPGLFCACYSLGLTLAGLK